MARDVTVTLSDGTKHIYKNVPSNITADQVEERALKKFPGQRVVKISGGAPTSRTAATAAGVKSGFGNVAIGAGNLVNRIAAAAADAFNVSPAESAAWAAKNFAGKSEKEAAAILSNLQKGGINSWSDLVNAGRTSLKERRTAATASTRQARPNYFTLGEIGGEAIATAPAAFGLGGLISRLGGAFTKLAPAVSQTAPRLATTGKKIGRVLQATGRSVQTGGTGVRAVTREAVKKGAPVVASRGGRIATRVVGGAGAGITGAALSDQDIADAAAGGAVVPLLGTIARRGMGWTFDLLSRRLGEVKAAEIMRNVIADKASDIANALQNAPKNIKANTAEFLAKQGLLTPELAAATRIASAGKSSKVLEDVALARAAEQKQARAFIRGGDTQTEAMQNIAEAKQNVRDVTAPMREEALGAADIGRTTIVPLERQATGLRTGVQRELDSAAQFMNDPNWSSSVHQRLVDARAAEDLAANLRDQGLQPLDISSVVQKLRIEADKARSVVPDRERVLTAFADNLERRAKQFGGVIDATGLYDLRKNMGATIAGLLPGMEPKALQSYTAQIIGGVQPLIDDAIEAAGGKGWRTYLDTFAEGMRNVERQKFERELTKLPEARFVKVMEDDDPDFVADFFGPGRFDIKTELSPSKLGVAQDLASDIAAQRAVTQSGLEALPPSLKLSLSSGARSRVGEALEPGAANVFARTLSRISGGMPGVYGGGFAGDQIAQEYSNILAENVMRRLAPALANPAEASRLLNVRSAPDLLGKQVLNVSPLMRNAIAQYAQRYMMGDPFVSAPAEANYPE